MRSFAILTMFVASLSGCAMGQQCFDDAYPHYGSIAERTDRFQGRVGSVFAPAGPDVGETIPVRREDTAPVGSPQRKAIVAGDADEI